jgi:glutamyl-tRNA synthetase
VALCAIHRASFLLRVEDHDATRVRPGVAEQQLADLAALGVTFDVEPVVLSQRLPAYREALISLADRTYECFCSRREIAEAASAPHGRPSRYPGTCRNLTEAERERRRQTRPPALRLRADGARQTIRDVLHGEITAEVDDVVLLRNDGVPAYNLAVVIDDGCSGIDQIVRGVDLLPVAATQAYLARLLRQQPPIYAHAPLAVNAQGQRLAKRDGAVTLAELAAEGMGPDAVLGLIAESLHLGAQDERITLDAMLERFDPDLLPRTPWVGIPVRGLRSGT